MAESSIILRGLSLLQKCLLMKYDVLSRDKHLDFIDINKQLLEYAITTNQKSSLATFYQYRTYINHSKDVTCPTTSELSESIFCIRNWYSSFIPHNIDFHAQFDSIEDIQIYTFELLNLWLEKASINIDKKLDPNAGEFIIDDKSDSATSSYDSDDELVDSTKDKFECSGTLKELRNKEWRDKIKGRRIKILTGKHAGEFARFLNWNGTSVNIRIKGQDKGISINIMKEVAILKRRRFRHNNIIKND